MDGITIVDGPMTRFMQSFVNLTDKNSTLYPATSVLRVDNTANPPVSSYEIYPQWAFRVVSLSAIQA